MTEFNVANQLFRPFGLTPDGASIIAREIRLSKLNRASLTQKLISTNAHSWKAVIDKGQGRGWAWGRRGNL